MSAFEGDETGVGFARADEAQRVMPGSVLVYIDLADVDAVIARAKELGAPIFLDKMEIPTVGWMAIFGDPGGNRIAVMQPMPPTQAAWHTGRRHRARDRAEQSTDPSRLQDLTGLLPDT